jgi:16S rRNA (guanine1516-N2)-methyltransferase
MQHDAKIAGVVGKGGEQLAARLGLPQLEPASLVDGAYFLRIRSDRLELCRAGTRGGVYLAVDEILRRVRGRKTDLGRACGANPGLRVCDATAGLGVDALTLAALGCRVCLIERSPVLHALLSDAINRLMDHLEVAPELLLGDAEEILASGARFDVVYLDPMFPGRDKSALPNKRAQFLAGVVSNEDVRLEELLVAARGAADNRVVVKRRRLDSAVGRPDWQIVGKSVRFDVYRGTGVGAEEDGRSGLPTRIAGR